MPRKQNAVTVQLTVYSAIKMACVWVSTLGGGVKNREPGDMVRKIKERYCFGRTYFRVEAAQ